MDDEIMKSLLMKAKGYTRDEVQEEYAVSEGGELTLVKRRVTEKYYPPDGAALKTYLELFSEKSAEDMSDEELAAEREQLLRELALREEEEKAREGNP